MDTVSFLGVKRPDLGVDQAPHLEPRLKRAIPLLHLWASVASFRVEFTFIFTSYVPPYTIERAGGRFFTRSTTHKYRPVLSEQLTNELKKKEVNFAN
jgi:hypothetical protein